MLWEKDHCNYKTEHDWLEKYQERKKKGGEEENKRLPPEAQKVGLSGVGAPLQPGEMEP